MGGGSLQSGAHMSPVIWGLRVLHDRVKYRVCAGYPEVRNRRRGTARRALESKRHVPHIPIRWGGVPEAPIVGFFERKEVRVVHQRVSDPVQAENNVRIERLLVRLAHLRYDERTIRWQGGRTWSVAQVGEVRIARDSREAG